MNMLIPIIKERTAGSDKGNSVYDRRLNLYLDTHPNDCRAMNEYNCYVRQLQSLKREYEMQYGPLMNFGHSLSPCPWRWIEEPWPWEEGI